MSEWQDVPNENARWSPTGCLVFVTCTCGEVVNLNYTSDDEEVCRKCGRRYLSLIRVVMKEPTNA